MAAFVPSAQQQRIIGAPQDDDVLVVAGAGSGKTFTMADIIQALQKPTLVIAHNQTLAG